MSESKSRIAWIDVAKFVCIMFVMLSHLESNTAVLEAFYRPFFLSVFFFASGYVYNHKRSFKQVFVSKARRLFVPWLVFSVFNILLSQILTFNERENIVTALFWNLLQIRGVGDGLWFVAALFVAYIPFYFLIRWDNISTLSGKKKTIVSLFISVVLYVCSIIYMEYMNPEIFPWKKVSLPWHLEYIFQAMLFMNLGYLFKVKWEPIFDKLNTAAFCVAIGLIYLLLVYIPYAIDMNGIAVYEHVLKIIAIAAIISICKKIEPNKYMLYVGQNTLVYFAFHGKVYSLMQTALHKFAGTSYRIILDNVLLSSVLAVMLTVIMSFVLMIPAWIINRWFPFVLGSKIKKHL